MTDVGTITVATCHDELVDGLRARKESLGLSDAFIEHIADMTAGHVDKLLGPSRVKTLGRFSLDIMLKVLAAKLVLVVDEDQAQRMQARWEGRSNTRVRISKSRVSKAMLKRTKPLIMREFALLGVAARKKRTTGEYRKEIAVNAINTRWRNERARKREQANARQKVDLS